MGARSRVRAILVATLLSLTAAGVSRANPVDRPVAPPAAPAPPAGDVASKDPLSIYVMTFGPGDHPQPEYETREEDRNCPITLKRPLPTANRPWGHPQKVLIFLQQRASSPIPDEKTNIVANCCCHDAGKNENGQAKQVL